MDQDLEDSPITTLPRDFMHAQILPLLSKRDLYALSRTSTGFRDMFTPFERARMGQELFVDQRYNSYFPKLANDVYDPSISLRAREIENDSNPQRNLSRMNSMAASVLDGVRQVAYDSSDIPPDMRPAKARSLLAGLGFEDILTTDPDFTAPQYSFEIARTARDKLRNHYGPRWTPALIAGLMRRNPVYWMMLQSAEDPEDLSTIIDNLQVKRGARPWVEEEAERVLKRPKWVGRDYATDAEWGRFRPSSDEYETFKKHLIPPGPMRPFALRGIGRIMDPLFRARFSYEIPNLVVPHPSYTQVAPGSGMTPPTFKLLEGHASPW